MLNSSAEFRDEAWFPLWSAGDGPNFQKQLKIYHLHLGSQLRQALGRYLLWRAGSWTRRCSARLISVCFRHVASREGARS